jgi:hypothetical protein
MEVMMNKFSLTTAFAFAVFVALAAHAQTGGGSSGTGTGSGQGSTGVGQGQGTTQTTPNPGTIPPGQSGGVNTPGTAVTPGQGGQTQVMPPPVQNQIAPNLGANTNQFSVRTNGLGVNQRDLNTNAFGVTTNQFLRGTNMMPTGRANSRVFGTNANSGAIPTPPR